jgi:hypothetical protein
MATGNAVIRTRLTRKVFFLCTKNKVQGRKIGEQTTRRRQDQQLARLFSSAKILILPKTAIGGD